MRIFLSKVISSIKFILARGLRQRGGRKWEEKGRGKKEDGWIDRQETEEEESQRQEGGKKHPVIKKEEKLKRKQVSREKVAKTKPEEEGE